MIERSTNEKGRHGRPHLRHGGLDETVEPAPSAGPQLSIRALGPTVVESSEGVVERSWLFQRPFQLLKYLVCRRDEVVSVDRCVEELWPGAGIGGRNSVRQAVFSLREMLEPERGRREASSFILTRGGSYVLNRDRIQVDIDEFEGLVATGAGSGEPDLEALERAVELYRGDLFAEDLFAEWVFPERERLRDLADWALRRLVIAKLSVGDLRAADHYLAKLVAMWPLEVDAHRAHIAVCLGRGRVMEANRRYAVFRRRLHRDLGVEPGFTVAELADAPAHTALRAL